MKKIFLTSAAILAISVAPAMAEGHSEGDHGSKGGVFNKHDTNGDGVISKDEFLNHAEERFGNIDTDGDGTVSKEEAKAGHEKKRAEIKERSEDRRKKLKEYREKKFQEQQDSASE